MPVQRLSSVADVDDLVAELFDPGRTDPIVVVTTRNRETTPLIDPEPLAAGITPLPVRLLETGDLTRHLTANLPDLFGVFGGAARIWWPNLKSTDDPHRHPLVFCYAAEDAPRATQKLLSELERGTWQNSRYLLTPSTRSTVSVPVESWEVGTELPAKVVQAQPGGGEVELGGTRAWLVRRRRDPVLVEGSMVRVVITGYDGAQPLVRRVDQPEPAAPETSQASSATVGPRPGPRPATPAVTTPLAPPPPALDDRVVADLRSDLQEALRRASLMEARAEAAEAEVAETARAAQREIRELRKERRSLQDKVKHLKAQLLGGADVEDVEDAFRAQLQRAYERTTSVADRETWPLQDYQVGPAFLESLDVQPELRPKVVEVCADVVSGRFRVMPGREHHDLRSGIGGDAPQVTRADGARAYRIAVQIKTPSARRLHYWRLPDGSVELSRVVLHDDMTIT